MTVEEFGRRYLAQAERRGRKPSTLRNIESEVRLPPRAVLRTKSLDATRREHVRDLVVVLAGKGLSAKSIGT